MILVHYLLSAYSNVFRAIITDMNCGKNFLPKSMKLKQNVIFHSIFAFHLTKVRVASDRAREPTSSARSTGLI